jgi:tetratricopeptide (TPR) repeat protein
MARTAIPPATAAKAMFLSNRTCCVCRKESKPVQIHHVDGDNRNHGIANLAVLCLDCHNQTQIRGGFQRKLDADQVILYRDDWHSSVARMRATDDAIATVDDQGDDEIRIVTAMAESLRDSGKYVSLAIHYDIWGNSDLRDKYIERAIGEGVDTETEIFLRSLQGKPELVSSDKVELDIRRLRDQENWSQLGRLYNHIGRPRESIEAYCRAVVADLEANNTFAAAFYLKELCKTQLHLPLFEIALQEQHAKNDIWWILRCLQELEWEKEAKELLISKRSEIETSDNLNLKASLYLATGETDRYLEIQEQMDKLEIE